MLYKENNSNSEEKEVTPEEKLQKIIDLIIEDKSDNISINKLKDIIGIEPTFHKNVSKPFMPSTAYKEFHNSKEYKENYIS